MASGPTSRCRCSPTPARRIIAASGGCRTTMPGSAHSITTSIATRASATSRRRGRAVSPSWSDVMRSGDRPLADGADDRRRCRRGLALCACFVRGAAAKSALCWPSWGRRRARRSATPPAASATSSLKNTGIGWNGCRARPAIGGKPPLATLLARRYQRRSAPYQRLRACPHRAGLPALAVAHSDVLSWWQRFTASGAARMGTVPARGHRRAERRRPGCRADRGRARRSRPPLRVRPPATIP